MIVTTTRAELKAARDKVPGPVVLVPTMGALHDGHRALLRRAREIAGPAGTVAVSIFVNPLQFGPNEDLDRYPRTLREDLETCAAEHVDLVFAPSVGEMYPRRQLVTVDPGPAGEILEGEFRPGFFRGVLTVVLKLFSLVRPDVAAFGQKDAQQLALVRQMVADFALGIEIEGVPTVRAADGLALSSRNKYLSSSERTVATVLHKALAAGGAAAARGPRAVLDAAQDVLDADGASLAVDYLALVSAGTYEPVRTLPARGDDPPEPPEGQASPGDFSGQATLAIAARLGTTRLIDNVTIQVGTGRDAADD
jgi:pantoate--beta-alanine ligase